MSKKYLQIIAFSILLCSGATQDARGQGAPTTPCCENCIKAGGGAAFLKSHPGASEAYALCIKLNCSKDVCPTMGFPVVTTGCCGSCITANWGTDKATGGISFESGMPYSVCIKQCSEICPDRTTPPNQYEHLKQQR